MTRPVRVCLALLLLLIPARRISAQAAADPLTSKTGSYSISGVVVSAATGKPLDRAVVALASVTNSAVVAETTTGEDGHFVFPNLAHGKFALRASRRGYITTSFDEHAEYSTAIATGEGLVSEGLTFKVPPQAVIYGTVTDDSGDPVQQASVSLFRQIMFNGVGNIQRIQDARTDDLGAYELVRLEPGNYYLAVTAKPWYSTRPQQLGQQEAAQNTARSPLDVAYARTFYADVSDSASATPIPVKVGDRVPVNFSLHAVPALHLRIQMAQPGQGGEGNRGINMPRLEQDVFGEKEPVQVEIGFTAADNKGPTVAEIGGIAPGNYQIVLPSTDGTAGRVTTLNATSSTAGDLKLDALPVAALADVSGKVSMTGGEKLPERLGVRLLSAEGQFASGAGVDAEGNFAFHGIAPGSYRIEANAPGKTLAVTRIKSPGAVDGTLLNVGSEPVALTATLVEGAANISGFARRDGKPVGGVMVLLVPRDPAADRMIFRRDQSDSDGSFTLQRVVPGDYTLIAIEDGWTLDWTRAGVVTHYLPLGQAVRVLTHSRDFTLPNAVEVQAR